MTQVKALILTGFGLNCDHETALALELAGAVPHRVHINSLVAGTVKLADFHILAFGGGFSWGDDHGAGVIQAVKLKNHIGKDLLGFVAAGKLIIGICNGFQALVNLGLLPGLDNGYTQRSVAITYNDCGNFRDQWVHLTANSKSPCVFTRGIGQADFQCATGRANSLPDPTCWHPFRQGTRWCFSMPMKTVTLQTGSFRSIPTDRFRTLPVSVIPPETSSGSCPIRKRITMSPTIRTGPGKSS